MFRDNAFEGKTVVITGGGTGLGKSMAKYYVQLGANVVITSRRLQVLEDTSSELNAIGPGVCFPVQCDVRHYNEVENLLAETLKKFNKVDILVNNAAGNFISPTERLSHRAFNIIIDIVLKGSFNCSHVFGKHWIDVKQEKAKVLSIVTTYSWTGSAFVIPSASAKAGVLAMTKSLAVEWAKYGIYHNAVAPGPFPTKGAWERLFPKDLADKFDLAKRVPLQRNGEHSELATLVAFLTSDFSDYINGEVVTIDGGEWLNGAGQFNMLQKIPNEMWDQIEASIRQAGKKE